MHIYHVHPIQNTQVINCIGTDGEIGRKEKQQSCTIEQLPRNFSYTYGVQASFKTLFHSWSSKAPLRALEACAQVHLLETNAIKDNSLDPTSGASDDSLFSYHTNST